MNIIIPCAGIGERFKKEGYDLPKPLINVLGQPMIFKLLERLTVKETDTIYIVYNGSFDEYRFIDIIKKRFHYKNIQFISLHHNTRGAAETVLCGINKIENLSDQILILDCDTFYEQDIISRARLYENNSVIFYFKDKFNEPIFSYIDIDETSNGKVKAIKEKVKISPNACTGAYGFRNGFILKKYCELLLNSENKSNGEYYISDIYKLMIEEKIEQTFSMEIDNFWCLGTPNQLKSYCVSQERKSDKKRFLFDLDNTLVTYPLVHGDYSTVQPIKKNIEYARYLHELGHEIIIQTARNMKSSNNNPGEATKRAYGEVHEILTRFEIPYDEIYFGKPYADFYIDDLSIKPYAFMERELGFYNSNIEPRSFNKIEYVKDAVIKTTNNDGELYYLEKIKESFLQIYFPKIISIVGNKIEMQKVDGIVFSYLLVNNSLTKYDIEILLVALANIYSQTSSLKKDESFFYDNYKNKVEKRFNEFDWSVSTVYAAAYLLYQRIQDRLSEYESKGLAIISVIHGDLVFSNIFLCEQRSIKFIDPRGKVGDKLTIFGDIMYDYAKIYQSLYGYDFILIGKEINEPYLHSLRGHFENYFTTKFGRTALQYLKYITASLLFSLIPLHDDIEKQKQYFKLSKDVLQSAN